MLKGIGRVTQVPCNDQPVALLCTSLLGKAFHNRIETRKVKNKETGEEREYCNFGRNPTPLGIVPAKLDSEAAVPPATPLPNGPAAEPVSGATFGNE